MESYQIIKQNGVFRFATNLLIVSLNSSPRDRSASFSSMARWRSSGEVQDRNTATKGEGDEVEVAPMGLGQMV